MTSITNGQEIEKFPAEKAEVKLMSQTNSKKQARGEKQLVEIFHLTLFCWRFQFV